MATAIVCLGPVTAIHRRIMYYDDLNQGCPLCAVLAKMAEYDELMLDTEGELDSIIAELKSNIDNGKP